MGRTIHDLQNDPVRVETTYARKVAISAMAQVDSPDDKPTKPNAVGISLLHDSGVTLMHSFDSEEELKSVIVSLIEMGQYVWGGGDVPR